MKKPKHTLLLNANAEPLRLIRWQRAVKLWVLEKVNVLEFYDSEVHSQYRSWKIPAVVISRRYHPISGNVRLDHKHLYARDGWRCMYCGEKFKSKDLTWDHVIPAAQNGATSYENLVACCVPCNQRKGNKTPKQAGMPLLRKPTKPRWMPHVLVQTIRHDGIPPQWVNWISWIEEKEEVVG